MNNILVRTLSGAVFVSLILVPLFLPNPIYSVVVLFLFMYLGLIEFGKFFNNSKIISVNWQVNTLFSLAISCVALIGIVNLKFPIILITFPLLFFWAIIELFRKKENPLANIGVSFLGFIYVCIPLLLAALMATEKVGTKFPFLAGMFILIWTNDTFAFLVGKFFGKTPLFPRISPKKTWEGTIGGIVCTILMAYGLASLFDSENTLFWALSVLIIAPGAIFGDFLESLFKRSLNIKDSGTIMPGHGGILDRMDAALFTIPFFVAYTSIYNYYF